jgi:hypothetical protein
MELGLDRGGGVDFVAAAIAVPLSRTPDVRRAARNRVINAPSFQRGPGTSMDEARRPLFARGA